jgi:hypothetical protein
MAYNHTGFVSNDELRIVFDDQVMRFRIGDHTTMGDIARTLRGLAASRHGNAIAIDVTMTQNPRHYLAVDFLPADFRFEDDVAAEFEDMISTGSDFTVPIDISYQCHA